MLLKNNQLKKKRHYQKVASFFMSSVVEELGVIVYDLSSCSGKSLASLVLCNGSSHQYDGVNNRQQKEDNRSGLNHHPHRGFTKPKAAISLDSISDHLCDVDHFLVPLSAQHSCSKTDKVESDGETIHNQKQIFKHGKLLTVNVG